MGTCLWLSRSQGRHVAQRCHRRLQGGNVMKAMFDPTQEWEDFYPVNWLIGEGGPPFSPSCPLVADNVTEEANTVSIHADTNISTGEITWSISQLGYVLFK